MSRPRVLLTLPDVAWPLDGGKRLRCHGVLLGLAEVADVDVAILHSTAPPGTTPLPPHVQVRRWLRLSPRARGRVAGAAGSLLRGLPVHVGAQRWDVVRRRLREWSDGPYDLVWFGGLDHASALHGTVTGRHVVVDSDDVETDKWRAYLAAGSGGRVERLQRRIELPLWARIQRQVARRADAVVVCSDLDVGRFGSGRTRVVPNTYPEPPPPERAPRPAGTPPRVLVVASWATGQNLDAARHAVQDVLPELRRLVPDVRLALVGRGADALGPLVDGVEGVDLVGPVDSVDAELAAADVVLVPMRFGGGTRLKVLEAWAHGVPVVSTGLGCEGTGAVDGVHLLVRDDGASLAAGVAEVLHDPGAARRRAEAGRTLYLEQFTPRAAVRAVRAVVDPLLGTTGTQPDGGARRTP